MPGISLPTQSLVLRASSLKAFAKCPVKFRLQYREGLVPLEDTTSLRMGTGLHAMFEAHAANGTDAAIDHCNQAYAKIPLTADATEWETERNTLLGLFLGYQKHWENDPVVVSEAERHFELEVGEGLVVQGTIDALGTWQGREVVIERKTTSSSMDDSDYWGRLRNDVQISMYVFYLAQHGVRIPTLYDVIRKPTIKRKKFETPDEYLNRLIEDIAERPDYYYARREIARTDDDLEKFQVQLFKMANAIDAYDRGGFWWPNFAACRDPYPCPYASICHGAGPESACDGVSVPNGFKREEIQ